MNPRFVRVALPLPVPTPYTYRVPDALADRAEAGARAVVPVRHRELIGIVTDADAIYSQAKAAGAEILLDTKDEDYGGRGFTCRDPEGHLWSVGTYDPWAEGTA